MPSVNGHSAGAPEAFLGPCAGWATRREEAQDALRRNQPIEAVKIAMREMKTFAEEYSVHALPIETKAFFTDPCAFSAVFKASGVSAEAQSLLSEILVERGIGFLMLQQPGRALQDLEAAPLLSDTSSDPRAMGALAQARLEITTLRDAERREEEARKVPVTILTGFLGAGKTTLLNYILQAWHGKRFAIIENEVGQVGIDNQLIQDANLATRTAETITVLDNGCLCCTVRSDLVAAVRSILAREDLAAANAAALACDGAQGERGSPPLDGILIETTGLADPGPVCKTFYVEEELRGRTRINGVLTVVDACHFLQQSGRRRSDGAVNESTQQVGFADRLLLNKIDAVDDATLQLVEMSIRSINETCPIVRCSLAHRPHEVPLAELLTCESFSLERVLQDLEEAPQGQATKRARLGFAAVAWPSQSRGRHDSGVGTFTVTLEGAPLILDRFTQVMNSLRAEQAINLYRYKGVVCVKEPKGSVNRAVLQGVHDVCAFEHRGPWPPGSPPRSQIVFIGRSLDQDLWGRLFEKTKEGMLDD